MVLYVQLYSAHSLDELNPDGRTTYDKVQCATVVI